VTDYVVLRSVTVAELRDEMARALRGEMDWHDLVIDAYKRRLRGSALVARVRDRFLGVGPPYAGSSVLSRSPVGALGLDGQACEVLGCR
jgi:hypothetical protein